MMYDVYGVMNECLTYREWNALTSKIINRWTKRSDFVHSNDKTEQNESLPPREIIAQALSVDEEKMIVNISDRTI